MSTARKILDEDEQVLRRREDQSFWFKTSYFAEKYKLLVWLGFLFLLAFGFDFKTPAQGMKVLQKQIDTLRTDRDSLSVRQVEIRRTVRDLMVITCLEHREQSICQPYIGGRP